MPPADPDSKPRIAVVEDDGDLRDSTVDFLAMLGYPVWGVGSGEALYPRLADEPVDVVVLDVELPGDDGFTIAGKLRAMPDLAVVMVTARSCLDDRLTGLASGADTYLVKPVNLRELAANIDAVARRLGYRKPEETKARWLLDQENWLWIAPDGNSLQLTAKEYLFVRRLAMSSGRTVRKAELMAQIDGHAASPSFNRLDVLLARLRKKGKQALGRELPIKAVTAIGFAITVPCNLV